MTPTLLVLLSVSVTAMLHQSLKALFRVIEKAHAKPRKPGPRTSGVQPSGEQAAR